jgi:hypothetical protein
MLAGLQAGRSRALVVRGEAGIGKTALLDHVQAQAAGCRIARAGGVESEMELAFAGLHQLCTPMLDNLDRCPARNESRSPRRSVWRPETRQTSSSSA